MRAIVTGGRFWTDGRAVFEALDAITPPITFVIEGGQRTRDRRTGKYIGGVDYWAWAWAKERGIEIRTEYAAWRTFGRGAGSIRNKSMLDMIPDAVVAFPGGPGTANMVKQAREARVRVIEVGHGEGGDTTQ